MSKVLDAVQRRLAAHSHDVRAAAGDADLNVKQLDSFSYVLDAVRDADHPAVFSARPSRTGQQPCSRAMRQVSAHSYSPIGNDAVGPGVLVREGVEASS